ncbi:putative membrane protein YCR023C OS=Saccharomyces cerevisiae (strain ATCC 204508 / S288c) GN=YCR023C PE=1 SV=2 [Rhizoctonia solani AG-1 IB]|uniref:Putative membrane protein YCR023C n=1 Tax=Thanatephorus cucumeris (strain AG1-IB / isolate 7/3/14) TaxID=1108050 RepID=A0A0B7FHU2_THACB|nr:putative membrane protein YCR023C OS=Saccharomyces cerevisiae (strain ATCC 204508 / S288c) GN=YCR023C PE=1 SV=2 [Rhizoctonia solani AG-1 IB]
MSASQHSDRTTGARPQSHEPPSDPESPQQPVRQTPVPKLQLLSVCVSRIAEPFAYTQIFPYVNQMVWDLGVTDDPKKVGFYSGMIDSSFAFAQLLTVYSYGALSDRVGRKPVVLMGTFGVAISAALFGLSNSFTHMMAARMIAGLLSGYIAVLHSILGEITDDTNQAAAYPIYALCYPIGSFVGPLVGGALAKPNENIPHLVPAFLHDFFDKYPYMLPSMAACTVAVMSFTFILVFMEETLPSMVRRRARKSSGASTPTSYGARGRTIERTGAVQGAESSSSASPSIERSRHSSTSTRVGEDGLLKKCPSETDGLLAGDDNEEDEQPHNWSVRELLKLPELRQLYRSSVILSFLAESYVVVFVLFSYTKIQFGGLGFEPAEIGFVLAVAGSISFALQLLVLPTILRRAKPTKTFEACMTLWPIGFAIPPILNIIARASSGNGHHPIGLSASAAIWVGIWTAQLITKLACMGYAMNMIIARQSAPDQRALGTTNGLNQLFMCAARMFAPVAVSTLFALSTEHNWLGGHLVWVIMIVLSLLGWKAAAWN